MSNREAEPEPFEHRRDRLPVWWLDHLLRIQTMLVRARNHSALDIALGPHHEGSHYGSVHDWNCQWLGRIPGAIDPASRRCTAIDINTFRTAAT